MTANSITRRIVFCSALTFAGIGCHDWQNLSAEYDKNSDANASACVAYVVAGDTHTCARRSDATLLCWGDNRFGQLGVGDTVEHVGPVTVGGADFAVAKIYLAVGEGEISSDRATFTCALSTDGAFYCWGNNQSGQLGTGDTEPSRDPVLVDTFSGNVVRAAAGAGHTCAQAADGSLWCWGSNQRGQLGIGSTESVLTPTLLTEPKLAGGVDAILCGGAHTCTHRPDGELLCWGNNDHGQLGIGESDHEEAPLEVTTLGQTVDRVATGGAHTCAFTTEGVAWCWGNNQNGQLGTGDSESKSVPVPVDATDLGESVTAIYAGGLHTCALKSDGSLWCWGDNRFGQLGTGGTEAHLAPIQAAAAVLGTGVVAASVGGAHTCAVKTDGSVYCWGNNQYGQLDGKDSPPRHEPIQVVAPCE